MPPGTPGVPSIATVPMFAGTLGVSQVVWLPFEVWQARQTKVLLYQVINATNLFPHHSQEAQELRALAALELAQSIFEDIGMQKDRRQRITEFVRQ